MRVELIAVPYDSGRRGARMGAGPEHLLAAGIVNELRNAGFDVGTYVVELPSDVWITEVQSAFLLARSVAERVRQATSRGDFPLVLSGNCGPAALGAVSTLGADPRVFWFDAHGDFNTPDTSPSGFVDGMAIATLCGRCWPQLLATIPELKPVNEQSIVLIGARDFDALEAALLEQSRVTCIAPVDLRARLRDVVAAQRAPTALTYLHLDLDVLDPSEGRANSYAAPGGLSVGDLAWAVKEIAQGPPIAAAAVTAFDPQADASGAMTDTAMRVVEMLLNCVAARHNALPLHSPST